MGNIGSHLDLTSAMARPQAELWNQPPVLETLITRTGTKESSRLRERFMPWSSI
jgi:hypothetical protein